MERLIGRYGSSSPSTYMDWCWPTNLIHLDPMYQGSPHFIPTIARREERIAVLGRSLRHRALVLAPPGKRHCTFTVSLGAESLFKKGT
jgi:hypothetical protein